MSHEDDEENFSDEGFEDGGNQPVAAATVVNNDDIVDETKPLSYPDFSMIKSSGAGTSQPNNSRQAGAQNLHQLDQVLASNRSKPTSSMIEESARIHLSSSSHYSD